MEYITVQEAAEKWGVSVRRVQYLCGHDRIKGAVRFGPVWKIPSTAVLPNARKKDEDPHLPMPRKSPFLDMTDLYNKAGAADACAEMLINQPEAHALFQAQIAYRRGEIEKVYDHARYFLTAHSGFYAILGGGMLLAQCAIWRGDIYLWKEAKKHIFEAPCKDAHDREIVALTLAIIDSSIYDNKDYPEWFKIGSFDTLPPASHPSAKVFYIKYLYMGAFAIASKQLDVEGLSCAVAYHNSGNRDRAIIHIDRAIALALPDQLYGILTEYVRHFDGLLEERIETVDPFAATAVKELYKIYHVGWSRLSGAVRNRYVASDLSTREREIAKLAAFGFTTKDIAVMLFISESTVKQTILRVVQKTGVKDRSEFSNIL